MLLPLDRSSRICGEAALRRLHQITCALASRLSHLGSSCDSGPESMGNPAVHFHLFNFCISLSVRLSFLTVFQDDFLLYAGVGGPRAAVVSRRVRCTARSFGCWFLAADF